jgi:predicted metalloendopeptidase
MKPRLARRLAALALTAAALPACAVLDVAGLEARIDPCSDLYGHANRRWLESSSIPDDRSRWSMFDLVAERNERLLVAALERALRDGLPPKGTPQRMAVEFYASGMDREAIEQAGLRPIEAHLARAAAVSGAADLAPAIARLQSEGIQAGFAFTVRLDARNSTRYIVQLMQGGLGLPERDYYFRDDARSLEIRAAYRKHVERLFGLAGDDEATAARNAAAAIGLETELARASMDAVQRRDPDRTYNKMTPAALAERAPGFPWDAYFKALGTPALAELNVAQPDFLTAFARLARERGAGEWRAYLRWNVLRAAADKLPEAFARAHFDFEDAILRGRKAMAPRSRTVLDVIGGRTGYEPFGQALSMIYIESAFSADAKARADAMIRNIKAALAERLASLQWMSEPTRRRALEKLAAMQVKIAYPERWRDYAGADVGPYPFAENWLRAKAYLHRRNVSRVGAAADRAEWFTSPHVTNAFYSSQNNEIVFPAGILQPPFFDVKADDAVNYGAIGMIIGHEITHGFDDNGRRFDAQGNLMDWWTAEDARRYGERAQHIERQYSAFVGVEDLKVNGKLTLGENISDVGGLKIAYLALQKALKDAPREKVDGLSAEQRFFLSFAQSWRSTYRTEQERMQLRTDSHSPPRFRVAGAVAHMPEFARAFSCEARTLMSESDRVNIW